MPSDLTDDEREAALRRMAEAMNGPGWNGTAWMNEASIALEAFLAGWSPRRTGAAETGAGDARAAAEAMRAEAKETLDAERGAFRCAGIKDVADVLDFVAAKIAALPLPAAPPPDAIAFQSRVQPWLLACFGAEVAADRVERGDRMLEEVFELLQSGGYDKNRVMALCEYVWSRETGEPAQEVGGVMVTLAAYCLAHGLDMHAAGETELARVWTKVEKIRAKQAAKPKGSALPQEWPRPDAVDPTDAEVEAAAMATQTARTGKPSLWRRGSDMQRDRYRKEARAALIAARKARA